MDIAQEAVMAHRLEASQMVRGMGAGMKVLELLEKSIVAAGGKSELLVFMSRPRFVENIDKIAQAIVDCDWRIPASEMRHRAESKYRKEFEADVERLDEVRNFWWSSVLMDLGIPFDEFGEGMEYSSIPNLYSRQLEGRKLDFPIFLDHDGGSRNKVLIELVTKHNCPARGDSIVVGDISSFAVVKASYFDFDR